MYQLLISRLEIFRKGEQKIKNSRTKRYQVRIKKKELLQKFLKLARPDPLISSFFHSSVTKKITRYCVKPKGKAQYVVVVLGFSAGN